LLLEARLGFVTLALSVLDSVLVSMGIKSLSTKIIYRLDRYMDSFHTTTIPRCPHPPIGEFLPPPLGGGEKQRFL
jgi:hypothetical protein